MNISKFVIIVLILVLVNLDQASAATLFSHHDCEFTANVPGRMQPLEKRTDVGMVYGGMSALNIQGVNRQLAFQVECQKMENPLYNPPVATDVALTTIELYLVAKLEQLDEEAYEREVKGRDQLEK